MFRTCSLLVLLLSTGLVAAFTATPAAAQQSPDFGTLLIQVRPPKSEILIDGVQWPASETADPLKLQLAAGMHKVEVRASGYQTFTQDVTLHAGETVPLNVSLSVSDRPKISPPPPAPPPPPRPRVAQPGPPPPPPPQSQPTRPSHIQVVPNDDGFMFAPDVRFSEVNGASAVFVGGYGGMVYGRQLLIGFGAYFQVDGAYPVNGPYSNNMNYFGPVIEYRFLPEKPIGINVHALIGGGVNYGNCCYPGSPIRYGYPAYYGYNQGFFVAEPEVQLVARISSSVRLQGAIGYRITSGYNMDGVSGSVSVQIGK